MSLFKRLSGKSKVKCEPNENQHTDITVPQDIIKPEPPKVSQKHDPQIVKMGGESVNTSIMSLIHPTYMRPLISFGLVDRLIDEESITYSISQDGVLYIDGMLCTRRLCKEHPSSYSDCTAVSRGRMMFFNSDNLSALSVVFLKKYASFIVSIAEKEKKEDLIDCALQTIAGFFAHTCRHFKETNDIKCAEKVLEEYVRDLATNNNDASEFVVSQLKSWPEKPEAAIKYLSEILCS